MHSERVIWVIPILIPSHTKLNRPSWRLGSECVRHAAQGKFLFSLQTQLVHAPACRTGYSSPLLPTTHDTRAKKRVCSVLRCCMCWGQCASSCGQSCCSNPCCQEGRQGSPRAERRWDYEPFDLARFSVVLCSLSHSIMLCLSCTGCTDYKELSLFLHK